MSRSRWIPRLRGCAEAIVVASALGLTALWASIPTTDTLVNRNPRTTAFIELRRQQAAVAHRVLAIQWQWRRLEQISVYLRAAVVYAEDSRFYDHDGVDWDAIEKAAESNYQRGTLFKGGSTITQQLAKNLYLSPSRSLLRKLREILIAARIEDSLDKTRILEIYLNVVEWGDGIFGAEAAAQHWFGRSARQLSPTQAARLAAALPNPFTRTPRVRSAQLQRKVARILWQLRRNGVIDAAQLASAAAEAGLPTPPDKANIIEPARQVPAADPAEPAATMPTDHDSASTAPVPVDNDTATPDAATTTPAAPAAQSEDSAAVADPARDASPAP